ncbi:Type-1B angiotensin II receptor [Holothuria leucospilota]|uniref:Type-1B angiotensin II receptor n=1 Tax=Holothuria leucospilota TaxID=206669 RepID=A0A9Q0YPR7_HOLLE|nr:Type-1B angiotensin II receptor [Holothuria leucospilota]
MAGALFLYTYFVLVYRCIVTFIGVPGNLLIICVYWNKKALGSAQVFIQFLAICDLYACVLIPLEAHYWLNEFDYKSIVLCKIFFSLFSVGFYLSACVTVAIAMDRYLAVSKPVNGRWSRRQAKWVCFICVVVAVLVNATTPFTSGLAVVSIETVGVYNATACEQRPGDFESLSLLLRLSQYSCSLVFFVLIITMYIKLWRTFKKRGKVGGLKVNNPTIAKTESIELPQASRCDSYIEGQESSVFPPVDQSPSTEVASFSTKLNLTQEKLPQGNSNLPGTITNEIRGQLRNSSRKQRKTGLDKCNRSDIYWGENSLVIKKDDKKVGVVQDHESGAVHVNKEGEVNNTTTGVIINTTDFAVTTKRKSRSMSRLSQMLLLSTIIFLMTYALTLVIFMFSSLTKRLHRNSGLFAVVAVLRLSGSINHAVNPVIYSFMNPRFRADCSLLFKRIRSKFNSSVFGR